MIAAASEHSRARGYLRFVIWAAQVFILDSLAVYETRDPRDAEKIAERVLPRLQHVNSAVVLSAVKVRAPALGAPDFCASVHQAIHGRLL